MEIELHITLARTGEVATLRGSGTWFRMRFAVRGNARAVGYLTALLRDRTHIGYTGYTVPWAGRIGGCAPKLLDVLTQLDHGTPGRVVQITWHFVRPPDLGQLPPTEGGEMKGIEW